MAVALFQVPAGNGSQSSSSPVSRNFTINAGGTNTMLFVTLAYDQAGSMAVTAITFASQAMTSCGSAATNTGTIYAQVFYLANPPSGAGTLSVTVSGTITDIYTGTVVFQGVNQTTPVRPGTYQNLGASTDGSGNYSLVVSSNTSDLTLTCLNGGLGNVITSNQTRDCISSLGGDSYAADHATTAAASVTHTWNGGASGLIAIVGFSIQGPSTSGAMTLPLMGAGK